ncbi:MAG: cyclic dehypoxanthinyl futalosine synthase [Bacteroidales bacterium]
MQETTERLFSKVLENGELNREEALFLYERADLGSLMVLANELRFRLHPENHVGWIIDRNINITNVCVSGCKFCNFHCKYKDESRSYTTSKKQYRQKIAETVELGGEQILLQGGMHPRYGIDFYVDLFSSIKKDFPNIKLHALGPPEIVFISKKSRLSYRETLQRLIGAGLSSLPGAGAEILDNAIRKELSPGKCSADEWLEVMGEAHKLGMLTSATMMFGHIESRAQRIDHLLKLRNLQEEKPSGTPGFVTFVPWTVASAGTRLEEDYNLEPVRAEEYLRLIAISRIVLTNIPNIQASWLTVGMRCAQLSLHGGANDFGSIMIEENVLSAAGSHNKAGSELMQGSIRSAGFVPVLRNQAYEELEDWSDS